MKDPTDRHYAYDPWDSGSEEAVCWECSTDWPCAKIQKWQASDTYKVGQLQEQVATLTKRLNAEHEQVTELREQVRRNDITIRGVLMPFINDLTNGVTDGVATFSVSTDYDDFTSYSGRRARVATRREWTATYTSSSGTWKNGECTERTYHKR